MQSVTLNETPEMSGENSSWLQQRFSCHDLPLLDTVVNFVSLINMVTESLSWLWQPHQVSRAEMRFSWRTLHSVSAVDSLEYAKRSCCGLSWRLEAYSTALPSPALTSEKELWAGEIEGLLLIYLQRLVHVHCHPRVCTEYTLMMCVWMWICTSCFFVVYLRFD